MKKIKLFSIIILSVIIFYLSQQVYYKWNLLTLLDSSHPKIEKKAPVVNNIMTETTQKSKTSTTSFEKDANWTKSYSKQGDRTLRYPCESSLPVFKKHYHNWQGKKYIEKVKLEQVVNSILTRLPHIKNHENVVNLVVETAIAESSGGYNVDSSNGDHGVFQIRLEIAEETLNWLKYSHRDVYDITMKFNNKNSSLEENLDKNIPFGIALCISEYWRKAGPNFINYISTLKDRAIMWKSVYNTKLGKGTVEAYIKRNRSYEKIVVQRNQKSS